MKTLFLKDSVLFISIDGKEYEVSNPEILFKPNAELTRIQKEYIIETLGKFEWPGGVDLITIAPHPECNKARECLQLTDGLNCSQAYDARIRDTSLCAKAYKVARLLPKEKKVYNPALSGYKPESDYKQFEELASRQRDIEPEIAEVLAKHGHELFESSEPQEKKCKCFDPKECMQFGCQFPAPVESQEEMWNEVMEHIKAQTKDPVTLEGVKYSFSITRLTP